MLRVVIASRVSAQSADSQDEDRKVSRWFPSLISSGGGGSIPSQMRPPGQKSPELQIQNI
jgi:hypothetical protein